MKRTLKKIFLITVFYFGTTQILVASCFNFMIKKKDCVECFQGEYKFSGRDWHTGKYWSIPLSESIRYNERIQVDWLKCKNITILPEFQEETIDLRCPDI